MAAFQWIVAILIFLYFFTMANKPSEQIARNVVAKWRDLAYKYSVFHQIPADVILAVMCVESGGNDAAENDEHRKNDPRDNSVGLMGVTNGALQDFNRRFGKSYTFEQLKTPYINAEVGTGYLRIQLDRVKQDWNKAIMAYNGGIGGINIPATQTYLKKVIGYRELVYKIIEG